MDGPAMPDAGSHGLRRNLSVWQAVGLSVALMAPSMAANINPQLGAATVGRAVPLTFLLAAVGVLLVGYGIVRLCQYYQHSGSVYAFVGLTLGPRTGVVSGFALFGTYVFYAVVTSSAAGLLGTAFLDQIGVWNSPPTWAGFLIAGVALFGSLTLTIVPARRGTNTVLTIEVLTIALIVIVCLVVLVRVLVGSPPDNGSQSFTLDMFSVSSGTDTSTLFLGIVFGFLSFAGFEAAATLGEETEHPRRDIPRAILGTAIFGGVFFVLVTAIEMLGFGTDAKGVAAFTKSPALVGDLGTAYIGSWMGDLVSLGATISAFGCCLACVVGASRMLFAMSRDVSGDRGLAVLTGNQTPGRAAAGVTVIAVVVYAVSILVGSHVTVLETFGWAATIRTLLLLVAYALTTIGAIRLLFVQRKVRVPAWEIVIPIAALAVLGYTIYRNVYPYPASNLPTFWLPIVTGVWLLAAIVAVIVAPGTARRLGRQLAADEGFATEQAGAVPGSGARHGQPERTA